MNSIQSSAVAQYSMFTQTQRPPQNHPTHIQSKFSHNSESLERMFPANEFEKWTQFHCHTSGSNNIATIVYT